jgi:hypothetical protein
MSNNLSQVSTAIKPNSSQDVNAHNKTDDAHVGNAVGKFLPDYAQNTPVASHFHTRRHDNVKSHQFLNSSYYLQSYRDCS